MTTAEVDAYLASLDDAKRATLQTVRERIHAAAPGATEGLSYAVPAFFIDGQRIAGLSAAAKHLSYLPHSGDVLESMDPAVLEGWSWSKGAIKFSIGEPLPQALVDALVAARRSEIAGA